MNIVSDCRNWLRKILDRFDKFLEMPKVMKLAADTFSYSHDMNLHDRVAKFRKLFSMINTKFDPCKKVGCSINCNCTEVQFQRFWNHMQTLVDKMEFLPKDKQKTSEDKVDELEELDGGFNIQEATEFGSDEFDSPDVMNSLDDCLYNPEVMEYDLRVPTGAKKSSKRANDAKKRQD